MFLGIRRLTCIVIGSVWMFSVSPVIASSNQYQKLQQSKAVGWNTWDTYNVLSHVLLPEGLCVQLTLENSREKQIGNLNFFTLKDKKNLVKPGRRTLDGSYTSLVVYFDKDSLLVETASEGQDWVAWVTRMNKSDENFKLQVDVGGIWNRQIHLQQHTNTIHQTYPNRRMVGVTHDLVPQYRPSLSHQLRCELGDEAGAWCSSNQYTTQEIKSLIQKGRDKLTSQLESFRSCSEQAESVMAALGWNTIYAPLVDKVMTPVSRAWNVQPRRKGWVLFDWDTYFAAYMFSAFEKELAYINAIEITNAITANGFIPNWVSQSGKSQDRSQPPVGSFVCREIYKKYGEKWFLEEVFDNLLTWNRWWMKERSVNGLLCWGSDNTLSEIPNMHHCHQAACFESGLDNFPVYDKVPFNKQTDMLELCDVGLMGMYAWDCLCLADIAHELDKPAEEKELRARAKTYRKLMKRLWNPQKGIYQNISIDGKDTFSPDLAPTNFFPLLSGAASKKQAESLENYYFDPNEFYGEYVVPTISKSNRAYHDQTYWRGRVWGPHNLLVYLSLKQYQLDKATQDLAQRSNRLLQKNWKTDRRICENYNGITGVGSDVIDSDPFYHWGALLSFLSLIEEGYVPSPVSRIK